MIEKFPVGSTSNGNLYCSLTCLASHSTHQVVSAPALNPTTLAARIPSTNILISMHQAKFPGVFPSSLPVISAVSSLATPPLLPTQQQIPMQTQTVREVWMNLVFSVYFRSSLFDDAWIHVPAGDARDACTSRWDPDHEEQVLAKQTFHADQGRLLPPAPVSQRNSDGGSDQPNADSDPSADPRTHSMQNVQRALPSSSAHTAPLPCSHLHSHHETQRKGDPEGDQENPKQDPRGSLRSRAACPCWWCSWWRRRQ